MFLFTVTIHTNTRIDYTLTIHILFSFLQA